MIGHIKMRAGALLSAVACLVGTMTDGSVADEPAGVSVPLVNKDGGLGLAAAPGFGVEMSVELVTGETPDGIATRLTFSNRLAERRIAALEGVPQGPIEGARVLAFDYAISGQFSSRADHLFRSLQPTIVALFFESDGGAWYRMIDNFAWDPFAMNEIRLPLRGKSTRALFATDSDEAIR